MTTIKKPILILEDTDHVNASYVRAITKAGYTPKVHYGCDLDYDLRDFDAVFVDRDNAKLSDPDDIEGNIIFHTYLIKLFNATITKKRPYESWRIFPASEDSIGNTYLVDALTSIAEKKGIITDEESRSKFRVDILKNTVRKETFRDGAEEFEKEIARHLANLERRKAVEDEKGKSTKKKR